MVTKEEFDELNKKIRSEGIVMSRVPKTTRELFIRLADEEFASDYGLTLKTLLDGFIEYQQMKVMFFDNLNFKIDLILKNTELKISDKDNSEIKEIKLLDGSMKRVNKINKNEEKE